MQSGEQAAAETTTARKKKPKKRGAAKDDGSGPRKRARKPARRNDGVSAAQQAVNEQMRRALEEDQYSAFGSIVDTASEDEDEEHSYLYRGQPVRLERSYLQHILRKPQSFLDYQSVFSDRDEDEEVDEEAVSEVDGKTKATAGDAKATTRRSKGGIVAATTTNPAGDGLDPNDERDGGSIFGQTAGSSNFTWVECNRCQKWRRLRGVVDETKLPPKWYCSMNIKNDPERARCSAPEEEYDVQHTPESVEDNRTRKHLRVWVRRLQCNERYEARQPTLTRGKKRAVSSTSKDPYEWVRCCNPSCGKWRAVLRIMDAKTNVVDRTKDGEWYCVMNTWDEKIASCAAPQENLPPVGVPPWVRQDD